MVRSFVFFPDLKTRGRKEGQNNLVTRPLFPHGFQYGPALFKFPQGRTMHPDNRLPVMLDRGFNGL
jgi:hypothetical protein